MHFSLPLVAMSAGHSSAEAFSLPLVGMQKSCAQKAAERGLAGLVVVSTSGYGADGTVTSLMC